MPAIEPAKALVWSSSSGAKVTDPGGATLNITPLPAPPATIFDTTLLNGDVYAVGPDGAVLRLPVSAVQ